MSKTYVDNFNRIAGALSGSTSSDGLFTWNVTLGSPLIVANQAGWVSGGDVQAIASAECDTDAVYVEIDYVAGSAIWIDVAENNTYPGSGSNGYEAAVFGGNAYIFAIASGAFNQIATAAHTLSAGTYRLERNGSSVVLTRNGTTITSATDSSEPTGSGNRKAGFGGPDGCTFDNFGYGDLAGASPPVITDVDTDESITSTQTNVVITGTDFDTATVDIEQGAVTVGQSIDSQSATSIQFDVVFDAGAGPHLKHGTATLRVTNGDTQDDTQAITIAAPSGQLYVDIATPSTSGDDRITAVADIESGDQIQARGVGGGSVPAGLNIYDDATFGFDIGETPAAFDVRIWDVNDASWGAWATQSIGDSLMGQICL